MMEARPPAAPMGPEPHFLLELQSRSTRHRIFARSTRARNDLFLSTVASQYFVGSRSPSGHSLKSVSSPRFAAPLIGAVRTRTRAKRERRFAFAPPRQGVVRHACSGRPHP